MSFDPYEFDRSYDQNVPETLGQYTAKTFLWMMVGLLVSFGVGIVGWSTNLTWAVYQNIPGFHLILLVGTLIISFTMVSRIERMSVGTAVTLFLLFSALFGFDVSLFMYAYQIESILMVFLVTALYFGALAAYGFLTKSSLSFLRPILLFGLVFLIGFYFLSLFIPGMMAFDRMVSMGAIAVFLAYTAYDIQRIKDYYYYYSGYPDMLAKASIFSALQLYLDFLNLFVRLLSILGRRRN